VDLRKLFRVLAVLGALAFTVHEGLIAEQDYRNLETSMKIGDHSAAELYALNFKIDCAEIVVAWAFGGGLIYVLRSKTPPKP
jgi:hypothetical protein